MQPPPLVSVVIPARNAAATLPRAIASVQGQDYRPLEILVVDDGSTDPTAAVAERCATADAVPLRLIRLPAPRGAAGARNAGIAAAAGEVIAFQDADDEWLPGKLSAQMAALHGVPAPAFVACGCRLISQAGRDEGPLYGGQIPEAGNRAWVGLLARNTIATPSVLVRRAAVQAVGGFDETLPVAEDQDLWIRLSRHGALGYVDRPLVRVHASPNSLSGVGEARGLCQQIAVTWPMVQRHLAAQRDALTPAERRRIIGERLGRLGRNAYTNGLYREGIGMLIQASLHGFEPATNLWVLGTASPPAQWLKRRLRLRSRQTATAPAASRA